MISSNLFKLIHQIPTGHTSYTTAVQISPDSQYLATCSSDGTVKIFNFQTQTLLKTCNEHHNGVNSISWSPDSKYLASCSDDSTTKIWDISETNYESKRTLIGHSYHVTCVVFGPKGNVLVTGSSDEDIRVWEAQSGKCLSALRTHSAGISALDICWDGTIIASASYDGLIRLFDTVTGHCLNTLVSDAKIPVANVKFSPNGKYLLATSFDDTIRLWDYQNNKIVKTLLGAKTEKFAFPSLFITTVEGQTMVASGTGSGEVSVWDLNSKQVLEVLKVSDTPVLGLDFKNGVLVASGLSGDVHVYELNKTSNNNNNT